MFNVKMVDIGGNGVVFDTEVPADLLVDAELSVTRAINEHLHIHCAELRHIEDLNYDVLVNGHEIGLVVIRSL